MVPGRNSVHMGIFIASNQREELDPRWQRRRQRVLALIAFLSLLVAAAVVYYLRDKNAQNLVRPGVEIEGPPIYIEAEDWEASQQEASEQEGPQP